MDTTVPTIPLWKRRYREAGVVGLVSVHPGQPPKKLTPQFRAKELAEDPAAAAGRLYPLVLAENGGRYGVSKDLIRQVWREADLKPHRLDRYMASSDPRFEEKAAEVIGLYLNPPQHAAVFRVLSKRWIASTAACPYRRGEPSGTDSNTTGTGPCRCTRH